MIELEQLPMLNAFLNGTSATLILIGFIFIKNEKKKVHIAFMIGALFCSTLFLISYVIYHYTMGITEFKGQGFHRVIYFTVLYTHMVLAAITLPLVIVTVIKAVKQQFEAHKRLVKWTFPIWMYVSVTGVLIYLMLNVIYT